MSETEGECDGCRLASLCGGMRESAQTADCGAGRRLTAAFGVFGAPCVVFIAVLLIVGLYVPQWVAALSALGAAALWFPLLKGILRIYHNLKDYK